MDTTGNFSYRVDKPLLEGNAPSLPPSCKCRTSGNDRALPSTSKKYLSIKLPHKKKHVSGFLSRHTFQPKAYLGCLLILLGAFAELMAEVRVIDAGAIPYTERLSKTDFDQQFPGAVRDVSDLEDGWYVIYEHQSLNYYFGPILLESTGSEYLNQLKMIVEAAVAQRPRIEDYRLELLKTPLEVAASSGSGGNVEEPPQPKAKRKGFFRRLFGFLGF